MLQVKSIALTIKKTSDNHKRAAEMASKQNELDICQKKIANTDNDCKSIFVFPQALAGRGVIPDFLIITARKAIDASRPMVDSISEVNG